MGEYAEMMLDGTLCEGCGRYLGANTGHPMRCNRCQYDAEAKKNTPPKVPCPICGKRYAASGVKDHVRDKHRAMS